MIMILTVTLNPAVDKTCETEELIKGQVNRMRSVQSIPGGKGINVAKILRQLDQPVIVTGFVGGYAGRWIEESMQKMGVHCRFTRIAGETRTSMNILADTGFVTEILEPGPKISETEKKLFLKEFSESLAESDLVALCGSAPVSVGTDIYRDLCEICHKAGKKVILDTSGDLLKEGVKGQPDLVKPNRRELEYLAGRKVRSREDLETQAYRLVKKGIKKVVVSLGEAGLYYADENSSVYMPAPKVEAVNTVACGDSVVASLCMSELCGEPPKEALHRAAALSAANAVTAESAVIPMDIYRQLL